MARLLQRNKTAVAHCEIREYLQNDGRYFTATIMGWNGFKFISTDKKPNDLFINFVIPKVREIRDKIRYKTSAEQIEIIEEYPTLFTY